MCKRNGIAIAGSIIVDKLNEIGVYPSSGELTKILSLSRAVGGCVPNVAIDLKRIDPDLRVKAIGKLGRDGEGSFVLDVLSGNGVDVSLLSYGERPTSFTDVMSVVGGQRTFFAYTGACADFGVSDIDFDTLDVRMLHLGYFLLLDKIDAGDGALILKKAHEKGIKTSIDMVSERGNRYGLVVDCLKYVDNLIINEFEAGMLTDIDPVPENLHTICQKLKAMGVLEKIIIHTADMGVCMSENGYFELPSYDLPLGHIKGTTGAGDAFCAGALLGIYRGLDEMEILSLASKAAVASLTSADAISGMRSEEEIELLCKNFKRRAQVK